MRALAIASKQHGVITWRQLRDLDVSPTTIRRSIAAGRLIAFAPGTYLVVGSPNTWRQKVMAAVLSAGPVAAAGHRAAAHLLALGVSAPGQIHVVTKHGTNNGQLRSYVVHRARTLGPDDVVVVDAIPVTCVPRTLVDLAGTVPERRLAAALDNALLRELTTIDACRTYIDQRNLGRNTGVGRLMHLLDDRRGGVLASELEREFTQLVERHGLERPTRQEPVGVYTVDFFYPEHGVLVEVDGRAWHGSAEAFERDHVRRNELSLLGYRHVLQYTWKQITQQSSYVLQTLRSALSLARA